jgi:hypothetical protein
LYFRLPKNDKSVNLCMVILDIQINLDVVIFVDW